MMSSSSTTSWANDPPLMIEESASADLGKDIDFFSGEANKFLLYPLWSYSELANQNCEDMNYSLLLHWEEWHILKTNIS